MLFLYVFSCVFMGGCRKLRSLSLVGSREIPIIVGSQKPNENNDNSTDHHGEIAAAESMQGNIADSSHNGRAGIYMFAQECKGVCPARISLRIPPPTP